MSAAKIAAKLTRAQVRFLNRFLLANEERTIATYKPALHLAELGCLIVLRQSKAMASTYQITPFGRAVLAVLDGGDA